MVATIAARRMTNGDVLKLVRPTATHAHVTICADPDGGVKFYPDGDPERIEQALRMAVKLLHNDPKLIRCAAGTCGGGGCRHG